MRISAYWWEVDAVEVEFLQKIEIEASTFIFFSWPSFDIDIDIFLPSYNQENDSSFSKHTGKLYELVSSLIILWTDFTF